MNHGKMRSLTDSPPYIRLANKVIFRLTTLGDNCQQTQFRF